MPTFSLSSFTFIKRLFSSSSLSAIRVVSSASCTLHIPNLSRTNGQSTKTLIKSSCFTVCHLLPSLRSHHFLYVFSEECKGMMELQGTQIQRELRGWHLCTGSTISTGPLPWFLLLCSIKTTHMHTTPSGC